METRLYKIIDINGNLKTVERPPEVMQPYVDMGLAMESLPFPKWGCYRGSRDIQGNIVFEPFDWDEDGFKEAYAPLFDAYQKLIRLGGEMLLWQEMK